MWFDGRPYWIIGNRIAGDLYRQTARYRRDRLSLELRGEAEAAGKTMDEWAQRPEWRATVHGLEMMEDGDYIVAKYTEEEFGTETMFDELRSVGERLAPLPDADELARKRARLRREWELAVNERQRNAKFEQWLDLMKDVTPEFFEQNDAIARESWNYHFLKPVSVVNQGIVCDQ